MTSLETSPSDFERDSSLESGFADEIKAILGRVFVQRDITADILGGTDFAIFNVTPFRVAARLRRYPYYARYPTEFTIRWTRPSGAKTEIDKIREGLVDYLFYGFVDWSERTIVDWFLADLHIFRLQAPTPVAIKPNRNGDSELAAFDLEQFPSTFVVAASREVTKA
jgi:hypothetical protein